MTFIVGLAGPAKVGKTTTAQNIIKCVPKNIKIDNYAFASKIYEVVHLITDIPIDTLMDQNYKEKEWKKGMSPLPCLEGWTPRKLLQIIGTECFRENIDTNFWVESAIKSVSHLDIVIMSDARFPNEFEYCDLVIELKRDGIKYESDHKSALKPDEKYIDNIVELYPDMDYNNITNIILNSYEKRK